MPFHSFDLFSCIEASAFTTYQSTLYRLSINNSSSWFLFSFLLLPRSFNHSIMKPFYYPFALPAIKVIIDNTGIGEILWQHAPLTPRFYQIKYAIYNFP